MTARAADLFSGAGGLSLGLEQAGFEMAAAVEHDPVHAAVHAFNFPAAATLCRSVADLSGGELVAAAGGELDLIAGGPPCQGVSFAGHRALDDPRNALMAEFARVVAEAQPRAFLMENVPGLASGEHRRLLDEVVELLEAAGYEVADPVVLDSGDFGVPQCRKRLFLRGVARGETAPTAPIPTHAPRKLDGSAPKPSALPVGPSVWEAIGDLPDADGFPELLGSDEAPDAALAAPSAYASRLRAGPSGLTSSMRTVHLPEIVGRFCATDPGRVEPISRFRRLHLDGAAPTLRAGTGADRGSHTAPRPIHPSLPRVITVREAARLHSMPDWFRLHRTKHHGFREVGNAVPPMLGRAIAATLRIGDAPRDDGSPRGTGDPSLLRLTAAEAAQLLGGQAVR